MRRVISRLSLLSCLVFACAPKEADVLPFQNSVLPVEQRVDDLLSRMTLEEKISQMMNASPAIDRLGIPAYSWWGEALHGVARAGLATVFPQAIGLGATWDEDMMFRVSTAISDEARAKHHDFVKNNKRFIYQGLTMWSPNINIFRDPRWGRVAEGSGEDPYLGSEIAKAMVRGYQGKNLAADTTLMACVKHFALYGAAEGGRDYNTVDMSKVKMYEYYLPPYKAAIDAGAGSVMTSFNEIDGVPATGNKWLLTDLLRKQWGFKGFVVTDYTSINEMIDHGSGNLQEVSAQSLRAGTDMDMVGEGFVTTLKNSLQQGKVTLKQIDDACRRILEAKYKLGLFDDPYRYIKPARAAAEVLSAG